jgi:hypothetical protein
MSAIIIIAFTLLTAGILILTGLEPAKSRRASRGRRR